MQGTDQNNVNIIDNLKIKECNIDSDNNMSITCECNDNCIVELPIAVIGKENRNKTTLAQHLALSQQLSIKDIEEISE